MTEAIGFGFKPVGQLKSGNVRIDYKDFAAVPNIAQKNPQFSNSAISTLVHDAIDLSYLKKPLAEQKQIGHEKVKNFREYQMNVANIANLIIKQ